MAVVKNLMVRAGADFSAITKQANKAKASMSSMQTTVSKACSRMSGAASGMTKLFSTLGVAISGAALVSFAKNAKAAYEEASESEAKLAQVMRNTIGASNEEIRSVKELISSQTRLGVIDDSVQTAAAQELATYVGMTSSLKRLIPVMNDMVAQQFGMKASAEQATGVATMLGKVMSGQVGGLSRYGYYFDAAQEKILKFGTEEQRAAMLAEVVTQSVGGMNAALAATPSGRLQQVSNQLDNIKESFGQAVTTGLTVFIPLLNTVNNGLAAMATLSNKVAQSIANVFGGGASASAAAVKYTAAATGEMNDLTGATKAAGKAAKEVATMGFDTLQKLVIPSSSGVSDSDTGVSGGAGGMISESVSGAEEAAESIGWLERGLQRLKAAFKSGDWLALGDKIGAGINSMFDRVNWTEKAEKFGAGLNGVLQTGYGILRSTNFTAIGSGLASSFNATISEIDFSVWGRLAVRKVTAGFDFLGGAVKTLDWKQLGSSFGSFLRGAFDEGTDWIKQVDWGKVGTQITSDVKAMIEGIEFSSLAESFFRFLGSALGAGVSLLGGSIQGVVNDIRDYFRPRIEATGGNVAQGLLLGIAQGWAKINEWVGTNISMPFIQGVKGGMGQTWTTITDWWGKTVGPKLTTDYWKNKFSAIGDGFKSAMKGGVNSAIALFNKFIETVNKKMNISWKGITVAGKQVVPPGSVQLISLRSIPQLADGAVLRPNNPFTAILGDQTSGRNIETPERLLRQIYREESGVDAVLALLERILAAARAQRTVRVDPNEIGRTGKTYSTRDARASGT